MTMIEIRRAVIIPNIVKLAVIIDIGVENPGLITIIGVIPEGGYVNKEALLFIQ
jgi:hypothetical protein